MSQTEVVSRCHGDDGGASVTRTVELRDDLDVACRGSNKDLLVVGLRVESAPGTGSRRSAAELWHYTSLLRQVVTALASDLSDQEQLDLFHRNN